MREKEFANLLPCGIILINCHGTIVSANKAVHDILGLDSKEILEKFIGDDSLIFYDKSGNPVPGENHPALITLRTNCKIEKSDLLFKHRVTGKNVWIRCTTDLRNDTTRQPGWKVMMHFIEITDNLEMEERYKTLFDQSPFVLVMNELESGKYSDVNQKFCSSVNAPREDIIGKTPVELGYIPNPELDKKLREMLISNRKIDQFEFTRLALNRKEVTYVMWAQIISILGEKYSLTVLQDITDRKKAEEELLVSKSKYKTLYEQLAESRGQLRALTAHLQNVREEERIKIARDIHDDLGHLLTVMKLDLEECRLNAGSEPEILAEKIDPMIDLVNSGIGVVRRIATELRPGILDHFGLIPAIEWLIQQFQARTKINCSYSFDKPFLILGKEKSSNVFRIFQEVFTNIARHSRAKNVVVTMTEENNQILFTIKDDGIGFRTGKETGKMSFGILGMAERALSIGAEFSIESKPGSGTQIMLILYPGKDPELK